MDDIAMIYEREAGMPDHVPQVGVGFTLHPLEDTAASTEAGRPVYRDVEFVRIQIPGDREGIVFQPATAEHKRRYPKAYEIFSKQITVAESGTPIELWPAITRALAYTFKAAGIPTVEGLAQVHDGNLEKLGLGAREWREKARAFLAQAQDAAAAQKLAVEKRQLLDVIENLQAQIRELAERQGIDPDKLKSAKPVKARARKKAA